MLLGATCGNRTPLSCPLLTLDRSANHPSPEYASGMNPPHTSNTMYLRYGSYTHDLNECTLTFSVSTVRNEQERPVDQIVDWVITAKKLGSGIAALTTLETALLAAYSVGNEGNDAYLLANDGTTVVRSLLSAGSLHGVQIDRVDFPVGGGNEYANMRTAGIRLRAVYPATPPRLSRLMSRCRSAGADLDSHMSRRSRAHRSSNSYASKRHSERHNRE